MGLKSGSRDAGLNESDADEGVDDETADESADRTATETPEERESTRTRDVDQSGEPESRSSEPESRTTEATDQRTATDVGTDDQRTAADSIPYKLRRDKVNDGREQVPYFLREEVMDREGELQDALEEMLGEAVYKSDYREASMVVAQRNPEFVAEVLREWGYDLDF